MTAQSSRRTERRVVDRSELHAAAVNEHQARVAADITMAAGAVAFVYANFEWMEAVLERCLGCEI